MQIKTLVQEALDIAHEDWSTWVPAERISRQAWQDAVETLVADARAITGRPAFGLSEAEISVHYHKQIEWFARLIGERLGLSDW